VNIQHQRELRGKIYDISSLGARFISNKPYTKDSEVYVGLLLPNCNSLINVNAKVVRCEQKENNEFHIALEFKEDNYQQSLIAEYIRVMKLWDEKWGRDNK